MVAALFSNAAEPVLHAERTFFGVYRVMEDRSGRYTALAHGTTLHGMQAHDSTERREPLTYFHRTGPIGQVFAELPHLATTRDVAIVGLGIGTLATYARPGQRWTLYEIDPAVDRIARTSDYFTYLDACGAQCRVILGDARLSLARAQPNTYGLIVLDAFNSDAIPVHLLTRQALDEYMRSLAENGLLAFHVSSRLLDLRPILADLARDAGVALVLRAVPDIAAIDWNSPRTPIIDLGNIDPAADVVSHVYDSDLWAISETSVPGGISSRLADARRPARPGGRTGRPRPCGGW